VSRVTAQSLEVNREKLLVQEQRLKAALNLIHAQIVAVKARAASYEALKTCLSAKVHENACARSVLHLEIKWMTYQGESYASNHVSRELLPEADAKLRAAQDKVMASDKRAQELAYKADSASFAAVRHATSLPTDQ
jgi:hypothetical protein